MNFLPTITMVAPGDMSGQTTLRLMRSDGPMELPIDGQLVNVPFDLVRSAMTGHWLVPQTEPWPPRRAWMSPPDPLDVGEVLNLPDGTRLVVPASQILEIPEQFHQAFEAQGWTALAQFA